MSNVYQIGQSAPSRQSYIAVKAMGLIRRGKELLLEEIYEKNGPLIGYRPLGGHIEFGEKSWEALEREFMEELGEDIKIIKLHSMVENVYEWGGQPGHEIVFMYETEMLNKDVYQEDIIERMDISNDGKIKKAFWLDPDNLPNGLPLFPAAFVEKLKALS